MGDMNPNDLGVTVGIITCGVFTKEASTYYNLSEEAQDFVRAFDELARSDNKRSDIKPTTLALHIRKVTKTYIN